MHVSETEMSITVDRFMTVGARWCLDGRQIASLLGITNVIHEAFDEADVEVAVREGGRDAERRMRLLIDVDTLLSRLVPEPDAVPVWLRTASVGYVDDAVTPLVALASSAGAILSLRNYLQDLPDRATEA